MRLFILGATGGTGRQLIDQALARGHQVTAFVRSPEKLSARPEGLSVLQGDPRDAAALTAVLPGHDAVLSALGPPGPRRSTILPDSARSTVSAMQSAGLRRLLIVSAAILFEDLGLLALFPELLGGVDGEELGFPFGSVGAVFFPLEIGRAHV